MSSGFLARLYKVKASNVSIILICMSFLSVFWIAAAVIIVDIPHQSYDPEYAYFLTSLKSFVEGGYTYVDHPGTPLEVAGTLILAATYPFLANHPDGFIQYHLENPVLFLMLARFILLLLSIGTVLYFNNTVLSLKISFPPFFAVSLSLMYYALHTGAFITLIYWSHNSFNFPLGTLYLLYLFRNVRGKDEISLLTVFLLGLFAGLLTAIVIYFAAWIVGTSITIVALYLVRRSEWKNTIQTLAVYLASSAVGFTLAVLPIINQLSKFSDWIIRLVVHQGRYGTGPEGFTSLSMLVENFLMLFLDQPILFLSFGALLAFFIYIVVRWPNRLIAKKGESALAIGLVVQILVTLLIILKHPSNHNYYLLSIAAVTPVFFLVLLQLVEIPSFLKGNTNQAIAYFVLFGVLINLANSWTSLVDRIHNIEQTETIVSTVTSEYLLSTGRRRDEIVVVWGYGIYDRCNALIRINNNYTKVFSTELGNLCPGQYSVSDSLIFNGRAVSASGASVDITSLEWDFIITRETSIKNLLPFLNNDVVTENLGKVKTGLPGYRADQNIVIIRRSP